MPKVLLIEDDTGINTPLSLYIEQSGYEILVCTDGDAAFWAFTQFKPQIIILDINLPGKNGIEICREIRAISNTPIIILSARESENDKVTLLELGADDYVAKPFSPRELMARIAAILKRTEQKKRNKGKSSSFWNIEIDAKNFVATKNGEDLNLTKTEFAILD
jgi:DNA-binding response OmpR family regulator